MNASRFTDWPHLYREGAADHPVLLMLHGTGSNEQDIAALAAELPDAARRAHDVLQRSATDAGVT